MYTHKTGKDVRKDFCITACERGRMSCAELNAVSAVFLLLVRMLY